MRATGPLALVRKCGRAKAWAGAAKAARKVLMPRASWPSAGRREVTLGLYAKAKSVFSRGRPGMLRRRVRT